MNLAIAINRFSHGGGMESYTLGLIKQLAPQHSLTVYANYFDENLPEFALIKPQLIQQKRILKKLRPFFFSKQLDMVRDKNMPLIACNRSENADVFVCGGTHLGYLKHMNQSANLLDKLTLYREKRSYQTAKKIMAHSQLMQRELVDLYNINPDKIQVVYPPVDTSHFHNDFSHNAEIRQKYGFTDNEIVFVFPSTGHERKGLPVLANFFEQTNLPVKLAVAGSPLPRPMRNIVHLGFVKNMAELYRAVDFTIMASQYEPFGLIGVESVLCGTRVILSQNIACCEVLNENAGFFFDRTQPETLSQAIEQAVTLFNQKQHKINDVQAALNYNPSPHHHIEQLLQMLQS